MPEIVKAGGKAPASGVYKVVHAAQHAEPHYATALFGDIFPPCQVCRGGVGFELAIASVHINAHPLFLSR
jgi:hypothetical protein